jgi:hypothetical protein
MASPNLEGGKGLFQLGIFDLPSYGSQELERDTNQNGGHSRIEHIFLIKKFSSYPTYQPKISGCKSIQLCASRLQAEWKEFIALNTPRPRFLLLILDIRLCRISKLAMIDCSPIIIALWVKHAIIKDKKLHCGIISASVYSWNIPANEMMMKVHAYDVISCDFSLVSRKQEK